MRWIVLTLIGLGMPATAQTRAPNYYCTERNGERVELGGLTCIAVGCVPAYLARCEMSLNSPMWRKVGEGCPAVSAEPEATEPHRPS